METVFIFTRIDGIQREAHVHADGADEGMVAQADPGGILQLAHVHVP